MAVDKGIVILIIKLGIYSKEICYSILILQKETSTIFQILTSSLLQVANKQSTKESFKIPITPFLPPNLIGTRNVPRTVSIV